MKAVSIAIYGRVQGVGFRSQAQLMAKRLCLKGWVKNVPDGSVYIEAKGLEENIELFYRWCVKGPSWSRVEKVFIYEIPEFNSTDFLIK